MPIPTWTVGQVLASSDVNNWFVPLVACKTTNTPRNTTTTVTADPELVLPVAASVTYQFQAFLEYDGPNVVNQGIKFNWAVPAGATLRYQVNYIGVGGSPNNDYRDGTTTVTGESLGGLVFMTASLNGTLLMSSTSGSMAMQWAQNISAAANVTLYAQSYIMLRRIA